MFGPSVVRAIHHYIDPSGRNPYGSWLTWLLARDFRAATYVDRHVQRLGRGNFGDSTPVGGGVSELRIHFGPGYRVYYRVVGREVILLLLAGDKSSQTADILKAKAYWADHEERVGRRKP